MCAAFVPCHSNRCCWAAMAARWTTAALFRWFRAALLLLSVCGRGSCQVVSRRALAGLKHSTDYGDGPRAGFARSPWRLCHVGRVSRRALERATAGSEQARCAATGRRPVLEPSAACRARAAAAARAGSDGDATLHRGAAPSVGEREMASERRRVRDDERETARGPEVARAVGRRDLTS